MLGCLKLFILLIFTVVSATLLILLTFRSPFIIQLYKHDKTSNYSIGIFDNDLNHTRVNIRKINGIYDKINYNQNFSQMLAEDRKNGNNNSKYSNDEDPVTISNIGISRVTDLDMNSINEGFLLKHSNTPILFGSPLDNKYRNYTLKENYTNGEAMYGNSQPIKSTHKGNKNNFDLALIFKNSSVQNNKIYKILYWTKTIQVPKRGWTWFGYGREPFNKCEYSNCVTTRGKLLKLFFTINFKYHFYQTDRMCTKLSPN